MHHLQNQNVLILGLGASGLAMARWCAKHGAHVVVADTRDAPAMLAVLREELPDVTFTGGRFSPALVEGTAIRLVYRSPGLSPSDVAPVVDAARAMGIPVGGELDLFARALADLREVDPAVGGEEVPAVPHDEALPSGDSAAADIHVGDKPAVDLAEGHDDALPAENAEQAGEADQPRPDETPETEAAREAVLDEGDESVPAVLLPTMQEPEQGYRPAVLAITGTNGKTTVTSLTGQLVERAGKTMAVAGNIGPTLLDTLSGHIDAGTLPDVWVLELSSFQLHEVEGFEPTTAAVLNISQDHLDWHGDMTAYAEAKARIFGANGLMLLNRDDERVMEMLPPAVRVKMKPPQLRAHTTFGAGLPERPGDYGIETFNGMAWLVRAAEADETIKRRKEQEVELHIQRLMPVEALRIRGRHNATNALAALALAVSIGCPLGRMLHGLREYRGEPHRVESVAVIGDVEYFDDSKGTNVGATVAALAGLGADRKLVLILGGEGKGQDFSPLAEPVSRYTRAVVLIGRDASLIRASLQDTGVELLQASSMEEAVSLSAGHAATGDAVLMSPACASFDMFDNYEHRARVFCDAVQALAHETGMVM